MDFEPNKCHNRLMTYNWQQKDWPEFCYDLKSLENALLTFAEKTGRLQGLYEGLSEAAQTETLLDMLVIEAIKTSEIEGAYLSRKEVLSSIKKNLGIAETHEQVYDDRADGIGALITEVRAHYDDALDARTLFKWHSMLMKGARGIEIGRWRTHKESMQIVSGPIGKEIVHFEAPPSKQIPKEMKRFFIWFNDTRPGKAQEISSGAVRAAVAHIYFESVHPFEDGNGRIGRAISDKALAQNYGRPLLMSLSRTIEGNKNDYYDALKDVQRGNEISEWIAWFVDIAIKAQDDAMEVIDFALKKTKFFDRYQGTLNERQHKAIVRMMREGPNGFEGGMSAKKYMAITHTSKATATRDLQDLLEKGIFMTRGGGGRSTSYDLDL